MQYRFTVKEDLSDFSSGRVINSIPGIPAFPIRLMNEIFQYCKSRQSPTHPLVIYDPCCGSAYHLTALSFLQIGKIKKIYCSDVDEKILSIADSNLKLLTIDGLNNKICKLQKLYQNFKKNSHREALESAERLKAILNNNSSHLNTSTNLFLNNILNPSFPVKLMKDNIDFVFADIPYGKNTEWVNKKSKIKEVWLLLENILKIINYNTQVVIVQTNRDPIEHKSYIQTKKMKIGKRIVRILKLSR